MVLKAGSRGHGRACVNRRGLTLMEVLIGTALFAMIAYSLYFSFANILEITTKTKIVASATGAIQSQIEVIRNIPYQSVGIVGGWPVGNIPAEQIVNYDGTPFTLRTTIRNIDDPFDGVLGGVPNDTAPADYKLVEIQASCPTCRAFIPVVLTARVAPLGLETASNNGSLFVNVFDALGVSVSGANVTVVNMSTTPTITINDTTNANGLLQLIDIPTSTSNYQITVTKSGYSTERTYPIGAPANPNPVNPHATVAQGQVTQVSLPIDRLSSVSVRSIDTLCLAVPNVDFTLTGTKLIGTSPDVLKFATSTTTGAGGATTLSSIEWDTYTIAESDPAYDIRGHVPQAMNWQVAPSSTYGFAWTVVPANPSAFLVTVQDASGTQLVSASATLSRVGFSETQKTGWSSFNQTDWSASGTSGFSSQSGGVYVGTPGQITLATNASGTYNVGIQEWLISNTFDMGTSTTSFFTFSWLPVSQPPSVGSQSVLFQVAGNNDNTTWNFVGPDGTGTSFFETSGTAIAGLAGMRYFRYRVFLKTADELTSPSIIDVVVTFGSGCVPAGQAYFGGLVNDTYTLTIERSGFQTTSTQVVVAGNWQEQIMILSP